MSEPAANAAFERHRDELDVTRAARPQGLASTVAMLAAAYLVAAVLGAETLHDWAYGVQLDWGEGLEPLVDVTAAWRDFVDGIGALEPHRALHRWLEGVRLLTW